VIKAGVPKASAIVSEQSMSSSAGNNCGTLWNAPKDAGCPALDGIILTTPSPEEAVELMRTARQKVRERGRAYQTELRDETRRGRLP
jgi:hypothetical protein